MGLILVTGVGIVCFVLLYVAFNIDRNEHLFLKSLFIFIALGLLLIIPKNAIDEAQNCQVVLDTITEVTTVAGFIPIGDCKLFFDDGTNATMTANIANETYEYTKPSGFLTTGVHQWNITCSGLDEDTLSLTESVAVFP